MPKDQADILAEFNELKTRCDAAESAVAAHLSTITSLTSERDGLKEKLGLSEKEATAAKADAEAKILAATNDFNAKLAAKVSELGIAHTAALAEAVASKPKEKTITEMVMEANGIKSLSDLGV